jgi:hypothetical protein
MRVTVIAESGTKVEATYGCVRGPGRNADRTEPLPAPGAPCGIEKLRIAALGVPLFETKAGVPAGTVFVVPT